MGQGDTIRLEHGGGGEQTLALIRDVFAAELSNPVLDELGDAAVLPDPGGRIAVSTDSFVVSPRFFPGGDVGSLAIHGTVNDLAVAGARPVHLTLGAILEEGLPIEELRRIVRSAAAAARAAGVRVVAGDTKVVERGRGHGIYLNTAGVGVMRDGYPPPDASPRAGDVLVASGTLGDHGAVILAARMGIDVGSGLRSDASPVTPLVDALFDAGIVPRIMRDPTRGGLAGVACDLVQGSDRGVELEEEALAIAPEVASLADLTGVDPLVLACEGRLVALVDGGDAEAALAALRSHPAGRAASRIGVVSRSYPGRVVLRTGFGGLRTIARPGAELLPRIC